MQRRRDKKLFVLLKKRRPESRLKKSPRKKPIRQSWLNSRLIIVPRIKPNKQKNLKLKSRSKLRLRNVPRRKPKVLSIGELSMKEIVLRFKPDSKKKPDVLSRSKLNLF